MTGPDWLLVVASSRRSGKRIIAYNVFLFGIRAFGVTPARCQVKRGERGEHQDLSRRMTRR